MTSALATLGVILIAWLSFALAASLVIAFAYPAASGWLRESHPRQRAALARAAALAPSVLPTLLVLACLTPGVSGLLDRQGDHCLRHGDHPHLCLVHWTGSLDTTIAMALMLGGGALAFTLARGTSKLGRSRRAARALRSLAHADTRSGVRVVSSAAPFCFTTGLTAGALRGEIWVSSALATRLAPAQLDVVVAHERAHLDRRDAGWRLAAELFSFPLYPRLRRAILQDEALAAEQACDEAAGQRVGDRLRVAETLLVVERLAGAAAPSNAPGLLAFRGSSVAARVRSLLEAPPPEPSWQPGPWIGAALLGGALWLAADPIHHWTEHWLRVLL